MHVPALTPYEAALKVRTIYVPGFAFPTWVLQEAHWANHRFEDTTVFYHEADSFEDVLRLTTEREPCNIGMRRIYNRKSMKDAFGYEIGAYSKGYMPSIAVYCNATIRSAVTGGFRQAHVINLVGLAFDAWEQPDYKFFHDKPKEHIVYAYTRIWRLALAAAQAVPGIKRIKLYNVGGGAFAGTHEYGFTETIFEPAFRPLMPAFAAAGIEVAGYDWEKKVFNGGFIPDVLETDDLDTTLYVNAWDPWSLIGNGNERDSSLDGSWGRISNMAVLGWRITNPVMKFKAVAATEATAVPP